MRLIGTPEVYRGSGIQGSTIFKFADNGDIVGGITALTRVDREANRLFTISHRDIEIDIFRNNSYTWWVTDEYVLFYSDETGERAAITRDGVQLYGNATQEIAESLREHSDFRNISPELTQALDQYLDENQIWLEGNKLCAVNGDHFVEFYKIIAEHAPELTGEDHISQDFITRAFEIIGWDNEGNIVLNFRSENYPDFHYSVINQYGTVLARYILNVPKWPPPNNYVIGPYGSIYTYFRTEDDSFMLLKLDSSVWQEQLEENQ